MNLTKTWKSQIFRYHYVLYKFVNYSYLFSYENKKLTNKATDIDDDLITANKFFGHSVKEITFTKYLSDKELIPTFSPYEVRQYSESMLKHLPKDALAKILKKLLYSKKLVYFNKNSLDRRVHNGTGETQSAKKRKNAIDLNIQERIKKFHMLRDEHVYEHIFYRYRINKFTRKNRF